MRSAPKDSARAKIFSRTVNRSSLLVRKVSRYAAVIMLPVICSLATYMYLANAGSSLLATEVRVNAPLNGNMEYTLPDNTKVWLSRGSSLSYMSNLAQASERDVKLTGESYFKVSPDKEHPFTVHMNDVNVVVTGTEFNCINKNNKVEVTLVEGSVNIENGAGEYVNKLIPNQQYIYSNISKEGYVQGIHDHQNYTAWRSGVLYFNTATIDFVADRLENLYDVTVRIENKGLTDKTITANFRDEGIEEIASIISIILEVDYKIQMENGNKILIFK